MYPEYLVMDRHVEGLGMIFVGREARMGFGDVDLGSRAGGCNGGEMTWIPPIRRFARARHYITKSPPLPPLPLSQF